VPPGPSGPRSKLLDAAGLFYERLQAWRCPRRTHAGGTRRRRA
jgi:hypothetical protein